MKKGLFLIFFICSLALNLHAEDCELIEKQIICIEPLPASHKNLSEIRKLGKNIPFKFQHENRLTCSLGLSPDKKTMENLVKWESSRLAGWLQKLQGLREARKLSNNADTGEIDKIEKLIKKSSLMDYAQNNHENLSARISSESVWHPKQIPNSIKVSMGVTAQELKANQFPVDLMNEMSRASQLSRGCLDARSKLKFLNNSAKKDSARLYHFKRNLMTEYSVEDVEKAISKCSAPSAVSLCEKNISEQTKILEKEFESQLCILKGLSPEIAGQLSSLSLEIPSVMGDLVTEGPGDRPTEEEAKSDKFKFNAVCREDFTPGGMIRMVAGAGASFLTHELSHEGVARLTGEKLEWNLSNGTWRSSTTPSKHRVIALAGLASHSISSEVIIQNQSHDSQFQKGWLFFNMFNTASYFMKDWQAKNGKQFKASWGSGTTNTRGAGDLKAFSKSESYIMGGLMMAHQLYSGYRYLQNRKDYECKEKW